MLSPTQPLIIAGREFSSRLLLGTGKFPSNSAMASALESSGTQLVTVALRRADLSGKGDAFANILDFIDPKKYLLLPNTSGAINAEEAVRFARLARAAGISDWIKLEIHPDPRYLLPDPICRPALYQCRSGSGQTASGCRHRHCHAAWFAHWQQSGN
jgi:thiazole synthase